METLYEYLALPRFVVWLRHLAMVTIAGILTFFAVQTCIKVHGMLSFVTTSVTVAAHGASYMGIGAFVVHLAKFASGFLPIASTALEFFAPGPLASSPEPLQLLDHLDARQVTAFGTFIVSVIGCILGKP